MVQESVMVCDLRWSKRCNGVGRQLSLHGHSTIVSLLLPLVYPPLSSSVSQHHDGVTSVDLHCPPSVSSYRCVNDHPSPPWGPGESVRRVPCSIMLLAAAVPWNTQAHIIICIVMSAVIAVPVLLLSGHVLFNLLAKFFCRRQMLAICSLRFVIVYFCTKCNRSPNKVRFLMLKKTC